MSKRTAGLVFCHNSQTFYGKIIKAVWKRPDLAPALSIRVADSRRSDRQIPMHILTQSRISCKNHSVGSSRPTFFCLANSTTLPAQAAN